MGRRLSRGSSPPGPGMGWAGDCLETCSSNSPHVLAAPLLGLRVQRRAFDAEREELGVRKLARCMS